MSCNECFLPPLNHFKTGQHEGDGRGIIMKVENGNARNWTSLGVFPSKDVVAFMGEDSLGSGMLEFIGTMWKKAEDLREDRNKT